MIPADGPLSANQRAAVLSSLRDYMRQHDVTQSELGAGLGESASTISSLLGGRDLGEARIDELLRAANDWIELDHEQRVARRPDHFHQTKIAERLYAIGRQARAQCTMALCWGPAGIGKTVCARALQADMPGTIYVLGNQRSRSAAGLLDAVYTASKRRARTRFRVRYDDVAAALRGSGRLLIVDQAHRLQDRALETLMDLHDECGVAVLLVATLDLHRRVCDDEDPYFGQLASRIMLRKDLFPELSRPGWGGPGRGAPKPLFTVDDIRALAAAGKLKLHPDAAKMLADIANYDVGRGHLRRVAGLLYWAGKLAERAEARQILVEHVDKAVVLVQGEATRPRPASPGGSSEEQQAATA